jgi:CRISPR-associated protein Cas2
MLKQVKGHAYGGQKSLYEVWLTKSELTACLNALQTHIDILQDRLLVIQLDARATVHTCGRAVQPSDGEFFYLG